MSALLRADPATVSNSLSHPCQIIVGMSHSSAPPPPPPPPPPTNHDPGSDSPPPTHLISELVRSVLDDNSTFMLELKPTVPPFLAARLYYILSISMPPEDSAKQELIRFLDFEGFQSYLLSDYALQFFVRYAFLRWIPEASRSDYIAACHLAFKGPTHQMQAENLSRVFQMIADVLVRRPIEAERELGLKMMRCAHSLSEELQRLSQVRRNAQLSEQLQSLRAEVEQVKRERADSYENVRNLEQQLAQRDAKMERIARALEEMKRKKKSRKRKRNEFSSDGINRDSESPSKRRRLNSAISPLPSREFPPFSPHPTHDEGSDSDDLSEVDLDELSQAAATSRREYPAPMRLDGYTYREIIQFCLEERSTATSAEMLDFAHQFGKTHNSTRVNTTLAGIEQVLRSNRNRFLVVNHSVFPPTYRLNDGEFVPQGEEELWEEERRDSQVRLYPVAKNPFGYTYREIIRFCLQERRQGANAKEIFEFAIEFNRTHQVFARGNTVSLNGVQQALYRCCDEEVVRSGRSPYTYRLRDDFIVDEEEEEWRPPRRAKRVRRELSSIVTPN